MKRVKPEPAAPSAIVDGRFELHAALGSGGMATVYRAWDRVSGRWCAVKVLGDVFSRDPEFRDRFRREAEAACTLRHPSVVEVYGCGGDPERQYIAMEYVPGGTLGDLLRRRGPLACGEAVRIAAEVADALGYAHGRGVIHRDIKPHNILLTDDGHVKVADFGIARTLDGTSLTRTGTILGSAAYISPEQARGETAGPGSDLYSLGVVLYEMLAGRVPFGGEAPVAVALKHVREVPPPLEAARAGLPAPLVEFVERLLAKSPEDRPPDAPSAARVLHALANGRRGDPSATAVLPAAGHAAAAADPTGRFAPAAGRTARLAASPETAPAGTSPASGATAGLPARETGVSRPVHDTSRFPIPVPPRLARPAGPAGLRLALIAALVAASLGGVAAMYRAAWVAAHVTVPALIGRTVADAGPVAQRLQLGLVVSAHRQDAQPVGVIVAQDPPPGRTVVRGVLVHLTVSQGSGIVPDIHGLPVAQAVQRLEAAGLRLGRTSYTPDDETRAGTVIQQFQPAGSHLDPNGAVDVLVSQGGPALPFSIFVPGPDGKGKEHEGR